MDEQQQTNPIDSGQAPINSEQPTVPEPPQEEIPVVAPVPTAAVPPLAGSSQLSKPLETDAKVFASLSYLSASFVIPWVVKKEHPFVAYHIKRGMALFFAEVVVWFALWLLESFLTTLFSFRVTGLILILNKLSWAVFVALSLIGIYYAATGQKKPLPWLEVIAKNIKI